MTDLLDAEPELELEDPQPAQRDIVVPFEFRAVVNNDGLTLSGYAAVFNSPTTIQDWDGEYTEQIAPGAFKRSLNARTPVMQFDHGRHPVLGSLPIAAIKTLKEDKRGLFVEARVFDNWMTQPLRDAITEHAVSGMSFRFEVVRDTVTVQNKVKLRTLNEVKLFELGPVVFPAYSDTSVALRSLQRQLPDLTALIGTPDEPVAQDTSDEPAITSDPADSHSRTRNQRRALALLSLRKGTP